jgi:anaphase-promoting complex subunit 6
MGLTALHVPTIPLHIACMYHLNHLHSKLFLMAHEMVDREPENALSWYAVGVWYLCNGKWGQARSYLRYVSLSAVSESYLTLGSSRSFVLM